jgi:hypothetical protein
MESIFIYLLKSSALITIFFLAYHFLVRKETFFDSNRWFLLSGLFTSIVLPFYFFEKIIYVQRANFSLKKVPVLANQAATKTNIIIEKPFDWYAFITIGYAIIVAVLLLKIIVELISLFNLLNNKKSTYDKGFSFIDLNKNITPFSFFKFIVYNSSLYSQTELANILQHEKIHSQEKHSIDVLISKLFCVVFWFNPFVWLYKKAITQNLEYIADQKAIENIEDKKAYQMTLLRVVSDQNCLSITNSFYQSLIKKRIVMLNKNQSKKWNSWKYALVVPVLVGFVIFFQVKVVAQEKLVTLPDGQIVSSATKEVNEIVIQKKSTDEEIKKDCEFLKKNADVDVKILKIKRNNKNEIIGIGLTVKNKNGYNAKHVVESDEPIEDITIKVGKAINGEVSISVTSPSDENSNDETIFKNSDEDKDAVAVPVSREEFLKHFNEDFPEPPTPPNAPDISNLPSPPPAPNFPPPPSMKFPKNPNDKKAIQKYEAEMDKYAKSWEKSEIKKYEADMKKYEAEMEAYQPNMAEYEKQMAKYEAEMEKYQDQISDYQEKIRDQNQDEQEALRDESEAKREENMSKKQIKITKRIKHKVIENK